MKDALGNNIEPGDIIVYNLGGELAVGKVLRIVAYKFYGKPRVQVKAQVLHSTGWDTPHTGISTIRNAGSIIRLKGLSTWL